MQLQASAALWFIWRPYKKELMLLEDWLGNNLQLY